MLVQLNFKSGKPVYRQIVEQVKYAAAQGALRSGEPLPSIRALAERLRINRNTVAKAYAELEHEGVVETRQGLGVFCTGKASPLGNAMRERILDAAIDAAIVQAHHFDVDDKELLERMRERLKEFNNQRAKEAG